MAAQQRTMLEKVFGSRTRVKLFRLFFTQPDEEFFVREISREVGEQINSVRRELTSLESIGLLISEQKDKKKFYHVDTSFPLYAELRSLILKSRLTLEKEFIKSISTLGPTQYLALTGYFVNDESGQVDLFIVGSITKAKMTILLDQFQKSFGRQLRFTVMTKQEYAYRKDVTDKFLYEIINAKKIVLIDKLGG